MKGFLRIDIELLDVKDFVPEKDSSVRSVWLVRKLGDRSEDSRAIDEIEKGCFDIKLRVLKGFWKRI